MRTIVHAEIDDSEMDPVILRTVAEFVDRLATAGVKSIRWSQEEAAVHPEPDVEPEPEPDPLPPV